MQFVFILSTVVIASLAQNFNSGNLNCGFTCSRNTVVLAIIDGSQGQAACSDNTNPQRCSGCCESRALQEGLTTESAAGFISNDGRSCVCCINNRACGGNTFNTFGRK